MSVRLHGVTVLCVLALANAVDAARAEEALDLWGRRFQGRLEQEGQTWIFRLEQGKPIPAEQLASVRFDAKNDLPSKVPLTKTLSLPNKQRLTGSLIGLDAKSIRFMSPLGNTIALPRECTLGIEQADGWLPLVQEPDADSWKAWKSAGKLPVDPTQTLFGNSALRFDEAGLQLTRDWPTLFGDGRISFVFRSSPDALPFRCVIEALIAPSPDGKFPALEIDGRQMRCVQVREKFDVPKTSAQPHALFIERQADSLRFFVDDYCLGQSFVPREAGLKGIRLSTEKTPEKLDAKKREGKFWIDSFQVARRLSSMPAPKNDQAQDWLWLVHGEQIFGRIVSANAEVVVLEAKFGKTTLPWKRLRGIGFATGKSLPSSEEPELFFRPGAGFSSDCLRGKLLRWGTTNLVVRHALLGDISIERGRLEKIHFAAK